MYCTQCGHENADGASFCTECGNALTPASPEADVAVTEKAASEDVVVEETLVGEPAADEAPVDETVVEETVVVDAPVPPRQTVAPQQPAAPQPAAPQQPVVLQRGVLGQAWHDITGVQGWFKQVFVLMLMGLVPVLGWYVSGYMLQWGASAANGEQGLPRQTFTRDTLLRGVLYAVIGLIGGLATAGLFYLNLIPFIGWIAALVWGIVVSVFTTMAGIRMTAKKRFGAAFDLSELVAAFKRDPWGLVAAVFVPALVVFAIVFVVVLLVGAMAGAAAMGAYGAYGYRSYSYSPYYMGSSDPFGMVAGLIGGLGVAAVIVLVVGLLLNTFAQLWSLRAVGVWVSRNTPEWLVPEEGSSRI